MQVCYEDLLVLQLPGSADLRQIDTGQMVVVIVDQRRNHAEEQETAYNQTKSGAYQKSFHRSLWPWSKVAGSINDISLSKPLNLSWGSGILPESGAQ